MTKIDREWYVSTTYEEREKFKALLKSKLNETIVKINFIKKDGTERAMSCTTSPQQVVPYEKKTERKASEETCFVFDTDLQQWRSFRFDSITSVEL